MEEHKKFCSFCGKQININSKFCNYCGKPVEGSVKEYDVNIQVSKSNDSGLAGSVAECLFKDNSAWTIVKEEKNKLFFRYKEDDKKASCLGGCLLLLILWPLAILYAILGGKKGAAGNIVIEISGNDILISGDPNTALKAHNILKYADEISGNVVETDTIKTANKAKSLTFLIIFALIIVLVIILSRGG